MLGQQLSSPEIFAKSMTKIKRSLAKLKEKEDSTMFIPPIEPVELMLPMLKK